MIERIIKKINETNPSFIFSGPRGIGKQYAATQIVKSLLCKKIPACNTCDECRRVDKEIHPNVIIIRPESDSKEIKIDSIRELVKSLTFSAAEGNKRFVIIDDAHRMNNNSSNTLLKTLEEPPHDTVFVLLTSNLHSMLPTIISRCEVVRFSPMAEEKMLKILNISSGNKLIPYAMGSISIFNFYSDNQEQTSKLIDFMQTPSQSYVNISDLTSDVMEMISSDNKAQELENMENIISLIMFSLVKKYEAESENKERSYDILNSIEEIRTISKKIYNNTSTSIVLENMLLEVAKLNS
ncbi:MAG: DNA polymerase III subunit delta' [bacterium]